MKNKTSVALSDQTKKVLEQLSADTGLNISALIELRLRGYKIVKES